MLLSLKKKYNEKTKKNNKKKQTTTKQTKTATTYNNPCLHHRWRCYQTIALTDQQLGPTSLANSASTPRRWSLDWDIKKRD